MGFPDWGVSDDGRGKVLCLVFGRDLRLLFSFYGVTLFSPCIQMALDTHKFVFFKGKLIIIRGENPSKKPPFPCSSSSSSSPGGGDLN